RRKIRIAVRGGDDVREDLAGGVQRGFDVRAGAGAETLRELTIPGVARRLGRVGETSPQLIEVPVALELVLIEAAIRLVENFDRPGVVRLAEHLRREHFVDVEAVAAVQLRGGREA